MWVMVRSSLAVSGLAGWWSWLKLLGTAILFLCSKEAKWITGLIMPVDGGVC